MISGIVLAAGTSSRFGRTKQLLELAGKPLVQHVVEAAAEAGLDEIIVVLGHEAERVATVLRLPANARTVTNPEFAGGQSSSLAAGLGAADPSSEAAVVLQADQPGIRPDAIRRLVDSFANTRARVVRLRYRNGPGPSLLSREIWVRAGHLHGDTGARELIASHPDWVHEVEIDADAPPDVDEPEDYLRLQES